MHAHVHDHFLLPFWHSLFSSLFIKIKFVDSAPHPHPPSLNMVKSIQTDLQESYRIVAFFFLIMFKSSWNLYLKNELGVHFGRHSTYGWQAKSFAVFKFLLFTSVNHITKNPQLPTYILPRLLVELTHYFKSWMTSSLHLRARTHRAMQSIADSCLSWVFCWYFSGSFSHSSM